jgi:hypothetical protein
MKYVAALLVGALLLVAGLYLTLSGGGDDGDDGSQASGSNASPAASAGTPGSPGTNPSPGSGSSSTPAAGGTSRPVPTVRPTSPDTAGIQAFLTAFWQDFQIGNYEAMYATMPPDYRKSCNVEQFSEGWKLVRTALGEDKLKKSQLAVTNIRLTGNEAVYDTTITADGQILNQSAQQKASYVNGAWTTHLDTAVTCG